jgi:hypothetical protein
MILKEFSVTSFGSFKEAPELVLFSLVERMSMDNFCLSMPWR